MQFYCVGESSCSDAIARCYNTGKPSLSIPCYGERRYGHAQDDEMVMAVPAGMMEKALRGMEHLYRKGVRYPISFAGAQADPSPAFPEVYKGLNKIIETLKGKDNRLLLGVTGGIASGKTTVTEMLKALGTPVIDFDVIARQVVEPGTAALEKIVDYFGRQVLQEDGTLDRKKVSGIVFRDFEKRKKLESFTHPPIYEEFFKQVNEIAGKDPDAIIAVAAPLLIELNFQYMFDKLLVVYIPREDQIRRLVERDKISEAEAANILGSQLPIDEKVGYADYVIKNENSLEETRKQVEEVWQSLKKITSQRSAHPGD
jgi:dephospho-CoA kinase